jgi:hypothetical protein
MQQWILNGDEREQSSSSRSLNPTEHWKCMAQLADVVLIQKLQSLMREIRKAQNRDTKIRMLLVLVPSICKSVPYYGEGDLPVAVRIPGSVFAGFVHSLLCFCVQRTAFTIPHGWRALWEFSDFGLSHLRMSSHDGSCHIICVCIVIPITFYSTDYFPGMQKFILKILSD